MSDEKEKQVAPKPTADEAIEQAKRAFALKKYEQAVDHYATALELKSEQCGENSLELADLYFAYGKALLENAISQSTVLGRDQGKEEEEASEAGPSKLSQFFSFSGDGEEGEDKTVDLFAEATKAVDENAEEEEEAEDDDPEAEPEDDFNAAWEVLDLARSMFEKLQEEDDESKLKLADTYMSLGDVSLETEKFEQAITDYSTGLELKKKLLPLSSRHIAEAHYRLSLALDITPGRLSDAIIEVQLALSSVDARLAELRAGLESAKAPATDSTPPTDKEKGKLEVSSLLKGDSVKGMSKADIEAESKEMEELKNDLQMKIEEMRAAPNEESNASAPEMVANALDRELNAVSSSSSAPAQVNDLTSMVKKKKKAPEPATSSGANGSAKRKAEDEIEDVTPGDKKLKLDA